MIIKSKAYLGKWGLAICFIFCLGAATVSAQGNIRLGKLKVELEAAYKAEYNDNIALDETDGKKDYIHTVTPGVVLKYEGKPGNFLHAGYRADIVAYNDYDESNYEAHMPFISLGFKSPRGLYMTALDSYVSTADPYGSENQYGEGRKTRRWNNSLGLTLGYEFGRKYKIESDYLNFMLRYKDGADDWQNRIDHRYGASFFYRLTDKSSLFAQYRHTRAEYDEQNDGVAGWTSSTSQDYSLDDYFLGVRFDPGRKLRGEIKLGYGRKNFDNEFDKTSNSYEDQSSWVAETGLTYTPSQKTELSYKLGRSIEGSPDTDSSSYMDTFMGVNIHHSITRQLSLGLGLDWNFNDYSDEDISGAPDKYFNIYTARAGAEWAIRKWFSGGMEYQYKRKNANDSYYQDAEYGNNIFSLHLSARF